MDLPLNLSAQSSAYVWGVAELEQTIKELLQHPRGSFLQSYDTGAEYDLHVSTPVLLEVGVKNTLAQVAGITVDSVKAIGERIEVRFHYRGDEITFQYPIGDEK